jgi:GT2 family glycosyltransferase
VIVHRAAAKGIRVSYVPFGDNVGYAKMVNAGIERATSPFILVLNVDTEPTPGAYAQLLDIMIADQTIGLVGPGLVDRGGTLQQSAFRFHRLRTIPARRTPFGKTALGRKELDRFTLADIDLSSGSHEVDWVSGAVMLVRRGAVLRVGGMDPRYFMYFEDVDWCRRMWKGNWKVVYRPEVRVVHHEGGGSRSKGLLASFRNRLTGAHIRSAIRYFSTHGFRTPLFGE